MIINTHTHNPSPDAIVNLPIDGVPQPGLIYSVGIHPWTTDSFSQNTFSSIEYMARNPQVVAIGECGLDSLRGASRSTQEHIFRQHISLSEHLHKPLIIHCVHSHEQILQLHRDINPAQPWIFHGFRLKPSIAEALIHRGIYLSLGAKFNSDSARIIPDNLLLIESDDTQTPITEIASAVASARATSTENIITTCSSNLSNTLLSIF